MIELAGFIVNVVIMLLDAGILVVLIREYYFDKSLIERRKGIGSKNKKTIMMDNGTKFTIEVDEPKPPKLPTPL